MAGSRSKTWTWMALVAGLALAVGTAAWSVDPAPVEQHIRRLNSQIHPLGARAFVRRLHDGKTERFQFTPAGYCYVLLDAGGHKLLEWSRKGRHGLTYERWYAYPRSQERLQEDDRNVSYTSYYRTGRKWEQYSYNRQKGVKSYDVYDKNGKLLP